MIVIKDELLNADPNLAEAVYQAFVQAKEKFLQRLNSGSDLSKEDAALADRRSLVGEDPLPYGVEPNRKALEAVIQMGVDQHILKQKVRPEELFAKTSGS
jgi:4,5-dihydroxyphthalate decarboxylase